MTTRNFVFLAVALTLIGLGAAANAARGTRFDPRTFDRHSYAPKSNELCRGWIHEWECDDYRRSVPQPIWQGGNGG